ncbi:MAG: KH domain-containing protein [Acidimicrobiaceae bacterium]|nr:KH domain-containing protein [Acidimicrobiaceae bacterium]MCY4281187.1 KH domain-containing protein [Acidimicrobiaceae bacterium]MCY4294246.1 KH domain-containing protein [Acidimicrobiaceae bacterium]
MSEQSPTAEAMCRYLVSNIVDDTEAVRIDAVAADSGRTGGAVRFDVQVAQGEMGRVIGKRGRVAQSIRTLVRAAGSRDDVDVEVEFVD